MTLNRYPSDGLVVVLDVVSERSVHLPHMYWVLLAIAVSICVMMSCVMLSIVGEHSVPLTVQVSTPSMSIFPV